MRRLARILFPAALLSAGMSAAADPVSASESRLYEDPQSTLRIAEGNVLLPSEGIWQPAGTRDGRGAVRQVVALPPAEQAQAGIGRRAAQIKKERELRQSRYAIRSFWWTLVEFARENEGNLPASLAELEVEDDSHLKDLLENGPHEDASGVAAPHYALVRDASMEFPGDSTPLARSPSNRDPLVWELQPLIDDGQHFVLFANGQVERIPVDTDSIRAQGLEVIPVREPEGPVTDLPGEVTYTLYGLVTGSPSVWELTLENRATGEAVRCRWNIAEASPGDAAIAKRWAEAAGGEWALLARDYDSPVLKNWTWIMANMFGADFPPDRRRAGGRRDVNSTDLFNVFGGRAAMRETLQLQALRMDTDDSQLESPTPIDQIEGVEVESHPFAEMLGDSPGGRLEIAEAVPADRFMVYIAKPEALMPMLADGASFIHRAGAAAVGRSLDYGLEERYLQRLGITKDWLRQLVESRMITEMAVFLPDLFVVDGTDITAIARIPNATLFKQMLSALGAGGLDSAVPVAVQTPAGTSAYWANRGDLFILGTNEAEVARVLDLVAGSGEGSLGQSAEFRYMLTELPVGQRTRAYAYFSDSFIRRLVGPQVKIGQLRRLIEIAKLQSVSSAELLYRYHEHTEKPSVETLQARGYLPSEISFEGISLNDDGRAVSENYGSPGNLSPLSAQPVAAATPREAEAYAAYLENYSRFWRRFFDPIAVRVDDTEDGMLEITTFILPLLDNSIYNGLRDMLVPDGTGTPMWVPEIDPEPVAILSLNLSEKIWIDFLDNFLRATSAVDSGIWAALDDLGPTVHFAIHDSNPVIAFGSGEFMGLGGGMDRLDDEMLAIPIFVSLLTRPTTLAVELRDDAAVRELLGTGGLARMMPFLGDMARTNYYGLNDRDAWVYRLSFFGINLRFQFEIQDRYLLISNMPWGPELQVGSEAEPERESLQLRLSPKAAEKQLLAMFTATKEKERDQAMEGIAYLTPLIVNGMSVDEALSAHKDLLGFTPSHPGHGGWRVVDGRVQSDTFGDPWNEQQPSRPVPGERFGILQGVERLAVGMQFEGDGLRTTVKWKYDEEPGGETAPRRED